MRRPYAESSIQPQESILQVWGEVLFVTAMVHFAMMDRFEGLHHLLLENYPMLERHGSETAQIALDIGKRLSLDSVQLSNLYTGALLHDIGLALIPNRYFGLSRPLTKEEWEVVRTHPRVGYEYVKKAGLPDSIGEIVLHHHERYDGTGYPCRLKGSDIPQLARICMLAEALDTMIRLKSPCFTMSKVIEELKFNAGTQFDPELVDLMLPCLDS